MAVFSWLNFLRVQFMTLPPVHSVDLSGQTVVVTGSNIGLGLETAKHLARMKPANLILAVRSKAKGDAALAEVQNETGFTSGKVMILDQGDFASVSAFVTEFEKQYNRLDVLIANAGIGGLQYNASKHGWESMIQVNHLSTSLLTFLLLPILARTANTYGTHPQVTVVASDRHLMVKELPKAITDQPVILEALSNPEYCKFAAMAQRYSESKLMNVLFVRSITSHLSPTSPIVVNSVNPGFCHSKLRRDVPLPLKPLVWLFEQIFARETSEGAKTYIWAALAGSNDAFVRDSLRGSYTSDCRIAEPSDYVLSQDGQNVQKRIWEETLDILRKVDPRVQGIVGQYLKY